MSSNYISKMVFGVLALILAAWSLAACSGVVDMMGVSIGAAGWKRNDGLPGQVVPTATPLPQISEAGCFVEECHTPLTAEQKQSIHPPFKQDQCLACHSVNHRKTSLTPEQTLELCYSCHTPASLGYSHPVGSGVIDPRNRQMLTCLSCHDQHSSMHADQLLLDGKGELCVSCHTEFLQ